MAMKSDNATPGLISTAAKLHDVQDACRLIQGSLGIVPGSVAGEFLSGADAMEWASLGELTRLRVLVDYISTERCASRGWALDGSQKGHRHAAD
ncbi:hypothetical protein D3C77_618180 [compost metagenome]